MNFAVIGTREPDAERLRLLKEYLRTRDPGSDMLVTGGAVGIDQAGAERWLNLGGRVLVHLPWPSYESLWTTGTMLLFPERIGFTNDPEAWHVVRAMKLHPNLEACSENVQKLHGRNVQIVESVDEVFALPGSKPWGGGTAMGIRAAIWFKKKLVCPIRQDLVKALEEETLA